MEVLLDKIKVLGKVELILIKMIVILCELFYILLMVIVIIFIKNTESKWNFVKK
jgi:hypothetical protein